MNSIFTRKEIRVSLFYTQKKNYRLTLQCDELLERTKEGSENPLRVKPIRK